MERNKIIRILIAGVLGIVVCFSVFYWGSHYSFGKALWISFAINFVVVFTNYMAMSRFNKDNKR